MNSINIAGMAGMNAMPGGPVGGVPMMNTQSVSREPNMTQESVYMQLNTCIYDYFLKRGQFDVARMLLNDENIKLDTDDVKSSPNHMNGVDGDTSMGDTKDEKIRIPDDFPRPRVPMDSGNSFLYEWFSLFWDIFAAQRKRPPMNQMTQAYVNSSQGLMRMREQANQNFLRQPQMIMQNGMANLRRNGVPNMNNMNLQKTALQNNASGINASAMNPQQIAQLQNKQQIQMQREHSDMDMNGHRPQSPSSADNAPSPSKRPRLEVQQGQPMPPNGRVPGQMPAQMTPQQAMLMQNGMNGRGMNPAQFQAFQQQQAGQAAAQQKSMQVYAQNLLLHHSRSAMNNQGMPNGLMNNGLMPNQNDLMSQIPDGQGGMQMVNGQFYNGDMAGMGRGMPQVPNGNGNHALQDYQMQLMLLEQQNKRRLMMARQEQDSITTRPDGQPMPPGQPSLPPGTSPQGSRTGASPNPSEQMKRGTPKISQTGLPGSPSAGDLQGRGSPASMNFNPGQMGADMNNAFFNNMRPPTSNQGGFNPQMNQAMQQPNGRMPNANWQNPGGPQGQPMVAQQSPATQAAPTPQERNTMPPPSAPPQGTKPPSPQQGAAPPTPQQANKPAPKKKDTGKERKRITKKGAAAANANTAATPSSEAEPPPTPTPSTPITPQHPNSFTKNGVNATTATQQQPTSAPAPPIVQQPDPNVTNFSDLGMPDTTNFSLDFSTLENPEVLENFDFDSFLNTDADATGFGFDPSSITYPTDGVETGTDGL
ncbi:Transcriptional activator somA [Talaromyces pinophilus]|nr:Transcriptional activator somA [Talaromyces pinophilus]